MTPQEEYALKKASNAADKSALAAHMAQQKAAIFLQCLSAVAGVAAVPWCGVPSAVLGAAGVWFFHHAKPPPNDRLDKYTGRGGPPL